jgi:RNA polymerase sigma-70 factor (ECF subfamily)
MTAAATDTAHVLVDPRFAAVYAEHVDHVWRSLRRLGVSPPELDDAVQETFLIALRRWNQVREDVSWRAWLFGIARRIASHHRRGRTRRLRLVDSVARQVPPASDLEDALARLDATRLVDHFLSTQPPRRREVFILAELEGFTGPEIAEALGISVNTVGSRLRSARESFARFSSALQAREHGDRMRSDRRALLRVAQREQMPEASRERIMGMLALPIASVPATTAAVAGGGWLGVIKAIALAVGMGAGMLGAVAGVASVLRPAPAAGDVATPPARAVASSRAATPRTVTEATSSVASIEIANVDPVAVTDVHPPDDVAPREPEASTHAERRRGRESTRTSSASRSADATLPAASPAPDAEGDAVALRAELGLAERIREATRAGEYDRVLELAAQHRRRFRTGELAVERDVHEIAALCGLGRLEQARARITAFGAAHHGATVPAHVRDACGVAAQKPTTPATSGQQD